VTPPKAAPPTETAVAKKESAPLWPWLVGGIGIVAVIGIGLFLALRKKSSDDDEEDEDDEEEEEKPRKKSKKSGTSAAKAKKSKK